MNIKENSSYIKGLLEGLSIDSTKPEGKIISALVDIIDKMAAEIEDMKDEIDTCNDYIEEIDEDLGFLEEIVYEDVDDECDCCCDDECDCDEDECDCCDCGGEFYETVCDGCGEKYYFDEDADPDDVVCPSCHRPLINDEEAEKNED